MMCRRSDGARTARWYHPLTAMLLVSVVLPSIVLALTTQVLHDPDG